jgi:hypothetical protein
MQTHYPRKSVNFFPHSPAQPPLPAGPALSVRGHDPQKNRPFRTLIHPHAPPPQTAADYSATGNAIDCLIASKRNFYPAIFFPAIFSTLKKTGFPKKNSGEIFSEYFLKKIPEIFPGFLKVFACQKVRMILIFYIGGSGECQSILFRKLLPGACPVARQTPKSTPPTLPYPVIILRREIAFFYTKPCRFLEKPCHFPGKTGHPGSQRARIGAGGK